MRGNIHSKGPDRSQRDPVFERKVRRAGWVLLFEQIWPRLWMLIGLAGLFVLVSLAGLWSHISEEAHKIGLALFALAAVLSVIPLVRLNWPSRDAAIRRLEQASGVPHRPATSYEDTVSSAPAASESAAIWAAHKARLKAVLTRMKVGRPSPRADRFDPFAVRSLLGIAIVTLAILAGDTVKDRLFSAFRFGPTAEAIASRLDAWVTAPEYTGRQPILLADGSRGVAGVRAVVASELSKTLEVPDKSVLVARTSGVGSSGLTLELLPEGGGTSTRTQSKSDGKADAPGGGVVEVRTELRTSGTVRLSSGSTEVARWTFKVIPDTPPTIALTKDPERLRRGTLKLTYKVEDDYGVVSAEARFSRAVPKATESTRSWARPIVRKGPRPPLERPPLLSLRLPRANAKEAIGVSHHELASHPWAGVRVRMTLVAKDLAGQIGRSEPIEFTLPARPFRKPLARAVIEQRRLIVEDPRNRQVVLRALDALTLEPDGFITDRHAYLGLRSAFWRLQRDKTRAGLKSVVEQLWNVALRIEEGGASEAERRLREAQEKLAKAIDEGASDAELQQLMQELRQAMNEYLEQMMRNAENQPPQSGESERTVTSRDLEQMLRNLENMARQGNREMAQQMLNELRDLMEQLRNGRMAQGQNGQSQEMMQMMDQMGDIIGREQQLLDDTMGEQRRQQGQPGQKGQQGQKGQRGQKGERGKGGDQAGPGEPGGEGPGGMSPGELGKRQAELKNRLRELRDGLGRFGMKSPEQFDNAERAMEEAERALREGDLGGAGREEQRALDQLRQGAQQMAEQMLKQMPGRGNSTADAPLDPLGRPQRTDGPDPGNSVKVPDEIDTQRAREILEELRRRFGEQTRPLLELDYLERLLKRF